MINKKVICLLCLTFIVMSLQFSYSDDWYDDYGGYYRVYDVKSGDRLFETARDVTRGDQYLSGDNKMYKVVRVNTSSKIAYAEFIEDITLPEIDELAFESIVFALRNNIGLENFLVQDEDRRVGIYCTHTAESYTPTDGSESIEDGGGILKVAESLKESFEGHGVEAIFDNTSHVPHDSGAYKRSRRTAVQLMRDNGINTLIDVHRDATPAEAYLTELNGEPASKVRLVIGRNNQNFKANEEMAWKIKSVADKMHPELIKDIFYAQGGYNQDLTPNAMLVEMGTYEHTRERAEKSTEFLSEALTTALYGGTFTDQKDGEKEEVKPQKESNAGSGTGIAALLAIIGGGGIAFLFLSSGGKEWRSKVSNFKDEFNSFLGRRKKK
ncbi:stage II sporulation protein P [Alkaliphilus peptidifermentans]|uniref:Stage II sporulation protein P n=1 Tax=Alkaliphilus peptidifermentans DSM 18978 TaxID=1120976 RepID=A0A1G5BCA4_9FIRM|nr:stage II sporulation protein P [Alkaliphilus peptidifermentans]SCX87775.1 stage II sporulation protein P [Alkaliphilus peptidifermentans DSM 18978]